MSYTAYARERREYQLALIEPKSCRLLVIDNALGLRLPRRNIPLHTRIARALQDSIRQTWNLHTIFLDFPNARPDVVPLAIAEATFDVLPSMLRAVSLDELPISELSVAERARIEAIMTDSPAIESPFSRMGWIDEAARWIESATGNGLASKGAIEQYNAGGNFALVRFPTSGGGSCWLKATGEPNGHEPQVTQLLSRIAGEFIPEVFAFRPDWNAMLLSGDAHGITESRYGPWKMFELLQDAVESMATLQMRTASHIQELLEAGAFDQRIEVLAQRSTELFDYLAEVLCDPVSATGFPFQKARLLEMQHAFQDACDRISHLGIPATVIHGDMNAGNIIRGAAHCRFIDWSETYLGCPLVTLEHLLLLNRIDDSEFRQVMNGALQERYLDMWQEICDPQALKEALREVPLLAAVSALFGRGDWLATEERYSSHRKKYARMLISRMDRALDKARAQEAICG